MRADLGAFLQHDDLKLFIDLLQPDRRGKACDPAAHDHDIDGHRFPFTHHFASFCGTSIGGDLIVALRGVKTVESPKMENRTDITLGEQYAATIDWWRDAGVDFDFTDEIEPLLAGDAKPAAPTTSPRKEPEAEKPPEPKINTGDLPDTLAGFRDWWVGPDNPFAQGHTPRIAPIGVESAPIMVLTTMPEIDDRDALLSGPQGKLLGNVLRAIGVDPNVSLFRQRAALLHHASRLG